MKGIKSLFCLVMFISLVTGIYWAAFVVFWPEKSMLSEMRNKGWREKVDINSASESELSALPAIGERRAEQIAEFRVQHDIDDVSDLLGLKNINKRVLEIISPYLETEEAGETDTCREK